MTIQFTDYVDLNKNDCGYDYYLADAFWSKFNEINSNANMMIEMLRELNLVSRICMKGV